MWYLVLTLLTGLGVFFSQLQPSVMRNCVLVTLAFFVLLLGSIIIHLFIGDDTEVTLSMMLHLVNLTNQGNKSAFGKNKKVFSFFSPGALSLIYANTMHSFWAQIAFKVYIYIFNSDYPGET